MSWISTLAEVYEHLETESIKNPGSVQELCPPATVYRDAQLQVHLSEQAELVHAHLLDKSDYRTLTPVTEKSVNRTSGPEPHLIFDSLQYLAGDFEEFTGYDKYTTENFEPYVNQMSKWVKSDPNNRYLRIVYDYIGKKSLIKDLINMGILSNDPADGRKLDMNITYRNFTADKIFVRFAIERNGQLIELWNDMDFLKSCSNNVGNSNSDSSLCYATGLNKRIGRLHGKSIRYPGDGAKLISSNDTSNYTYLGRFENANQVVGIGTEISEKAHSALRWLINKQALRLNDLIVLAYKVEGEVPQPLDGTLDFFETLGFSSINPSEVTVGKDASDDIKKAILGYRSQLTPEEQINLIVLDSATPGRLAIQFYQEMSAKEYLDNLLYFHDTMKWEHLYWKDKQSGPGKYIGVPSSISLIHHVFGIEKGSFMELNNKDKYLSQQLRRLLPCIINKAKIPLDFVDRAFQNAVTPLSKSRNNWDSCVRIACGIIRKYYIERRKVEFSMALDTTISDRSYLYGRLLAVAEKVERDAMNNGSSDRMTNANRLMSMMSKKPYVTWLRLEEKLQPYLRRLNRSSKEFYLAKIGEIMDLFSPEEFMSNRQVEGSFVLGFHCQLQDFYKKKMKETSVEEGVENVAE